MSQKNTVASSCFSPKSSKILLSRIACDVSKEAETYSASDDDWATVYCFFVDQENTHEPKEKIYPEVLLISSMLPSRSLSQ